MVGEAYVLIVVVGVTAVLSALTPGRDALERVAGGGFFPRLDLDATTELQASLVPAVAGSNQIHLDLYRNGLAADIAQDVTVEFRLAAQGIGPIERTALRLDVGHYVLRTDDLTLPGRWQIDIHVRTSEFDQYTAMTIVDIAD